MAAMFGVLRQAISARGRRRGAMAGGASQTWLNNVSALIGNYPKEILGWKVSAEALVEETVDKTAGSISVGARKNEIYDFTY